MIFCQVVWTYVIDLSFLPAEAGIRIRVHSDIIRVIPERNRGLSLQSRYEAGAS